MTEVEKLTGATPYLSKHWKSINWKKVKAEVPRLSSLPLVRCVNIRNEATPFDPAWTEYFKDCRRSSNTIPAKWSNY